MCENGTSCNILISGTDLLRREGGRGELLPSVGSFPIEIHFFVAPDSRSHCTKVLAGGFGKIVLFRIGLAGEGQGGPFFGIFVEIEK